MKRSSLDIIAQPESLLCKGFVKDLRDGCFPGGAGRRDTAKKCRKKETSGEEEIRAYRLIDRKERAADLSRRALKTKMEGAP